MTDGTSRADRTRPAPARASRRAPTLLAVLGCLLQAASATAQYHPVPGLPAAAQRTPWELRYEGRPFGLWDYAATGAIAASYFAVEFALDMPTSADWTEPVPLIDEPLRNLLVAPSRSARERAGQVSDYFWYFDVAYPTLISVAVPLVRGGNLEMAFQLTMINIEAFALVSLLTRLPHKLIGRERPSQRECEIDPDYEQSCDQPSLQYVSFFGGHTAVSMAGAGLACAHHLHAHLYGNEVADALGCGVPLLAGTIVAWTRLRADRHWASDNIVGAAVGLSVGYLLPTYFYYEPFWADDGSEASERSFTIVPTVSAGHIGLTSLGQF